MDRVNNSIKNIKVTLVGQILNIVISFIARSIFVYYLSAEYLGLNGLFTNIITFLSLADLGLGSAIVYSLYKPIAQKDEYQINALLIMYRKAYLIIAIVVSIMGLLLVPFLEFFIKDIPAIPNIKFIYLLFVGNTVASYLFSYKKALIIANQKKYIESIYHFSALFFLNIVQILILITTQNYIFFLVSKIIITLIENILISRKANKLYNFLEVQNKYEVSLESRKEITNNIKAMFLHRVGGAIVIGTDSLLISKFIGVIAVGIYSNYLMIINAIEMMFNIIFQSITASIGNVGATEDKHRLNELFIKTNFISNYIISFSSIALLNLLNPFIQFWLGKEFLFDNSIMLIIVINFYVKGQRKSVLTFRDALGLFWYDRYKPIIESLLNIIFSIYFALKIGVAGIFIGTFISTMSTAFWIEPYVLYKYGLDRKLKSYYMIYLKDFIITLISGGITCFVCIIIPNIGIINFIYKVIICAILPNIVMIFAYRKSKQLKYMMSMIKKMLI